MRTKKGVLQSRCRTGSRSTYAEEDWLIIISTDHGGTETGHGGQTAFERMTWLACNKPIEITEENKTYARTK